MKATITYKIETHPHPWDEVARQRGIVAWCLVEYTTPELGPSTSNPIAIFNYNSECERFQAHVLAEGLNGKLLSIDPDVQELLERRLANRK